MSRLPPKVEALIHEHYTEIDPGINSLLSCLKKSLAPEIWHKVSTFYEHLMGVWKTLVLWDQPLEVCRLGLFHSAYSNSFVAMGICHSRSELRALIGEAAESLVYLYCAIDRNDFEEKLLAQFNRKSPLKHGIKVRRHSRWATTPSGNPSQVYLDPRTCAAFALVTIADYLDQYTSWQELLYIRDLARTGTTTIPQLFLQAAPEATLGLWPGLFHPFAGQLHRLLKIAYIAVRSGQIDNVPAIFSHFLTSSDHNKLGLITVEDEIAARNEYLRALELDGNPFAQQGVLGARPALVRAHLQKSLTLNPWLAEPRLMLAQLTLLEQEDGGRFAAAHELAREGLDLLLRWGSAWDRRVSYEAWIAWARCLMWQASQRHWPQSSRGLQSLGAVTAGQHLWSEPEENLLGSSRM